MQDKFVPKLKLQTSISQTKLDNVSEPTRLDSMDNIFRTEETPGFEDVFSNLVKSVDDTVKAPDQIMQDAMLGNGADIHDVMISMAKAELTINVATQMTSKVIQAYEKVSSIQL